MNNIKKYILFLISILLIGCESNNNSDTVLDFEDETHLVFKGIVYNKIDVNGTIWLDRNLGAVKACETIDGEEECWGDLYQWGRINDGHESKKSNISYKRLSSCTSYNESFIVLKMNDTKKVYKSKVFENSKWYIECQQELWNDSGTGINEVCPNGWHVATSSEFEKFYNMKPKDIFSKIKLAFAGSREGIEGGGIVGGKIMVEGQLGFYWTSTIKTMNNISIPIHFRFSRYSLNSSNSLFTDGFSIRCVKNK